jgi:hypothetical protein
MGDIWNRCNICGRIIAYQEFADETAVNRLVNPDAYGSDELWDTYHKKCESESIQDAGD